MSTNGRSAPDGSSASGGVLAGDRGGAEGDHSYAGRRQHAGVRRRGGDTAGAGLSRKKRRRQRLQRGRQEQPRHTKALQPDVASRERIFQSIEGLLRQIREQAEEAGTFTDEQLREVTQVVTAFTKSLEGEGDPVSERALSEYHRIREKLSQALREMEGLAAPASRV